MLIGISGKIKSGKNEFSDMLSYLMFKNQSGTFKRFKEAQDIRNSYLEYGHWDEADFTLPNIHSFALNLKKCLAICTGIDFHKLEDRNVKSSEISWLGISYRQLLQQFGEGIKHTVNEKFWVNSLLSQYTKQDNWIISDVRYKVEADSILEKNGILIRINRPNLNTNDHISETDLDNYNNFNYMVYNDGSLEDLFNSAKSIYKNIIK